MSTTVANCGSLSSGSAELHTGRRQQFKQTQTATQLGLASSPQTQHLSTSGFVSDTVTSNLDYESTTGLWKDTDGWFSNDTGISSNFNPKINTNLEHESTLPVPFVRDAHSDVTVDSESNQSNPIDEENLSAEPAYIVDLPALVRDGFHAFLEKGLETFVAQALTGGIRDFQFAEPIAQSMQSILQILNKSNHRRSKALEIHVRLEALKLFDSYWGPVSCYVIDAL